MQEGGLMIIWKDLECIYNDGNKYKGTWKKDKKHGKGEYYYVKTKKWKKDYGKMMKG